MAKVIILKLKDLVGISPSGCQVAVDAYSQVIGMEEIPLADYPVGCGSTPIPTRMALAIVDPILGKMWVDATLDSWAILVGGTSASGDRTKQAQFTSTGTTTISSPLLYNVTWLQVLVGNVPTNLTTLTYTSGAGVGTITFPSALGVGDVVDVLYNSN